MRTTKWIPLIILLCPGSPFPQAVSPLNVLFPHANGTSMSIPGMIIPILVMSNFSIFLRSCFFLRTRLAWCGPNQQPSMTRFSCAPPVVSHSKFESTSIQCKHPRKFFFWAIKSKVHPASGIGDSFQGGSRQSTTSFSSSVQWKFNGHAQVMVSGTSCATKPRDLNPAPTNNHRTVLGFGLVAGTEGGGKIEEGYRPQAFYIANCLGRGRGGQDVSGWESGYEGGGRAIVISPPVCVGALGLALPVKSPFWKIPHKIKNINPSNIRTGENLRERCFLFFFAV